MITETWLNDQDSATRAALEPNGYKFKDVPRNARRGGGIGIMFKDSFKVERLCYGFKSSFQYSEWRLSWDNNRLRLCVIYHPPYSKSNPVTNKTFMEEFESYVESIVLSSEPLCITGDFNLHMDVPTDTYQQQMSNLLISLGLYQHVDFPTHKEGHTLDLLITRSGDDFVPLSLHPGYFISDHCFVNSILDFPKPNVRVKDVSFRSYKSLDMDAFKEDLSDICDALMDIDDPNVIVHEYNRLLSQCLDTHVPIQHKTAVSRPKVPWWSDTLQDLKCQRRKAERMWRDKKAEHGVFKTAKNAFVSKLFTSKVDYWSNQVMDASGNQKKLFSIIKSLSDQTVENPLPPHSSVAELANDFGNFFKGKIDNIRQQLDSASQSSSRNLALSPTSRPTVTLDSFTPLSEQDVKKLIMNSKSTSCNLDPIPTWLLKKCLDVLLPVLTKMVNLSLKTGVFPDEWKLALVIPLIKQLSLETIFPNYRPVSNLAFVSKVTEKAVINQSSTHIKLACPLPVNQSSYKEGHSTETALIKVQSDILDNMENQQVTLLVMIDLSAAFDTLDHNIMSDVLGSQYGISGQALQWFQSYLSNRCQQIIINNEVTSDKFALEYGVPQGSCLGPILFTQYASSLFQVISKHLCKAHGYADDHTLYLGFTPYSHYHQDNAFSVMEDCLMDVKQWMLQNRLKMNDSKTEFLIIGSSQQLKKIEFDFIMVGDISVKVVENVRNLGAYLDSTMSMVKHVDTKCLTASRQLYRIRKIRKYLTKEATVTLIHAFIFSHLDYCNSLLYNLPDTQIGKMQRIQNIAARLVYRLPKFSHVTPLFIELHWLPVRYRLEFKVLLFTFKAIHCKDTAPKYLCDMFNVRQSSHYSVRSNSRPLMLCVPKHSRSTFKARSLPVAGALCWNSLPNDIRKITKLEDFKTRVKTHLFKRAYDLF